MSRRNLSLQPGHICWLVGAATMALVAVTVLCLGLGGDALAEANAPSTVWIDPPARTVYDGSIFTLAVAITDAVDLHAYEFDVGFDPSVVTVTGAADAGFLPNLAIAVSQQKEDTFSFGATSDGMGVGSAGDAALAILTLQALDVGTSTLDLSNVELQDSDAVSETPPVEHGFIEVVEAPDASAVLLDAAPRELLIDETAYLTATVVDTDSVPLPLKEVVFTTDLGVLGSSVVTKTTDGYGRAYAQLTSGTAGTATVIATSDAVSDSMEIVFSEPAAPDIAVSPDVLTATLPPDGVTSRELEIGNVGDADLEWILTGASSASWLSVSPTAGTVGPAESTIVTVDFDAIGLDEGTYTATLEISSNDPDDDLIEVPVELEVRADIPVIEVTPSGFVLLANEGETFHQALTIANLGGADLVWDLDDPGVDWLSTAPTDGIAPPDGDDEVTLSFDATDLTVGETYTAVLVINSNDPNHPLVEVPVELEIRNDLPDIAVDPASFAVTLDVGDVENRILTIENVGFDSLQWALTEDPLVDWLTPLPTGPANLAPGESDTVIVSFNAAGLTRGETYTTTLVIVSNDPNEDTLIVPVSLLVASCQPVEIQALVSNSPVKIGQAMHFTATVSGDTPVEYEWDFGGEGTGTGLTTATPTWTYSEAGDYTVSLTVDNACGSDDDSLDVTVETHAIFLPLVLRTYTP